MSRSVGAVRLCSFVVLLALAALGSAELAAPPPSAAAVEAVRYEPPVSAPLVDPFRPPASRYGRGNRGHEYRTRPGESIVAAGRGRVAFSGPVAGRLVVSIDHPDGLRTTYTGLGRLDVGRGDTVGQGQPIGTAGSSLHFGVRAGRAYLDPAALFDTPTRVHLVETVPLGTVRAEPVPVGGRVPRPR